MGCYGFGTLKKRSPCYLRQRLTMLDIANLLGYWQRPFSMPARLLITYWNAACSNTAARQNANLTWQSDEPKYNCWHVYFDSLFLLREARLLSRGIRCLKHRAIPHRECVLGNSPHVQRFHFCPRGLW